MYRREMLTAAWWEAYFFGSLDEKVTFSIGSKRIGVHCSGTQRHVFVDDQGWDDRTCVMPWWLLELIAAELDNPDHFIAALQRFTFNSVTEFDDLRTRVCMAHERLMLIEDVLPFVERTLVTTNLPVEPDDAFTHITPRIAYDYEYERGAEKLREARRLPEKDPLRAAAYRESVMHFFEASLQDVSGSQKADALCYSGAMLVELSHEQSDDQAMLTLEQAMQRLDLATRADPTFVDGKRRAADALHYMGDRLCDNEPARAARLYEQGCQYARETLAIAPPEEIESTLDVLCGIECMLEDCLRRSDRPVEAKEALDRAIEAADKITSPTMNRACSYAAIGRLDEAMTILEVVAPERETTAEELRTNDVFDPLHVDPRWTALLAKLT
jgi:hypothetical protein